MILSGQLPPTAASPLYLPPSELPLVLIYRGWSSINLSTGWKERIRLLHDHTPQSVKTTAFLSKIFLGTWGYSTNVWLHKHELRPSSVPYVRVVDVGANYGGVAVALAKHFESAQLVVLEPNPRLASDSGWCTDVIATVGEVGQCKMVYSWTCKWYHIFVREIILCPWSRINHRWTSGRFKKIRTQTE